MRKSRTALFSNSSFRYPTFKVDSPLRALIVIIAALLSPVAWTQDISFDVKAFVVEGPNPLSERETQRLLTPFLGTHTDLERLSEAARILENRIRDQGLSFYRVILPPQILTSESIRVTVVKFDLGKIVVSGNKFFSEENVLHSLPQLRIGESPNTKTLSRALAVANRNPSKRTSLTFAWGEQKTDVVAELKVVDRKPHQTFAWTNNTGNESSGDTRLGIGFRHDNVFQLDHQVSLTFTTSAEKREDVRQFGVNYEIPMYQIAGKLGLFAVRSDVDSGIVADFFDVAASGEFYGARYSQAFDKIGGYRHSAMLEIDDKLFDNEVDFSGTPIGVDVRSRPLSLQYVGDWDGDKLSISFYGGYYRNISGGSFNNRLAYAATRSGADDNWWAIRVGGEARYNLPKKYMLAVKINAQEADEPLIPGEQFGLGGLYSLRGFEEREVTVDRGYRANVELWSPLLPYQTRLGVFVDIGHGKRFNALPGEVESETLSSAGLAATWLWKKRLSAGFYFGHVLDGVSETIPDRSRDGDEKFHFNVLYRIH